ncbi:unnamed protein product [marine sediment metagenome]|uniref:Uncharacterized protein n=1 Tax=marine sediment metagenome TaxID=412755 RepID=X0RX51_9ZZZZ
MMSKELIDYVESAFICKQGEARCSHEIKHLNKCFPYVAYAVAGQDETSVAIWMKKNVFDPLRDLGGKYLFWRLSEKIDFGYEAPLTDEDIKNFPDLPQYNGTARIYTRVLVLDDKFNPIRIEDKIKPEGVAMKEIAA